MNNLEELNNTDAEIGTVKYLINILEQFPQDAKYEITDRGIEIDTNTNLGICTICG